MIRKGKRKESAYIEGKIMETRATVESVGIEYWLQWQVPVCGLIMIIPAAVALKNLIFVNSSSSTNSRSRSHSRSRDLWIPCWRNLSPKWLLLYRVFAFLTLSFLLYRMFLFAGLFAFFFYTQWTFALVILYFALGTVISARGCFFMSSEKLHTQSTDVDNLLDTDNDLRKKITVCEADPGAGFLESAFLVIYQTSAGASILTDLVFWCLLVPMMAGKQFELTLVIGCIHSLNAVFLVIDSLFNSLPFQWFGFNYFMLWTVTYAIFQWVLHACGFTWWPYPFLDLATPWAPLWYLAIAVIHIPCYGLYILIVKAKNSIFSKLFPHVFLRSHQEPSDHDKAA